MLQVKYYGWTNYFGDYWNVFDVAHFVLYVSYFFFRVCLGNIGWLLPILRENIADLNEKDQISLIK